MSRFHRHTSQPHGALCQPALHSARSPSHYRCLLSDTSGRGYRLDLLKDSFGETVKISFTVPNACVMPPDYSVCRSQMEDGLPRFHRHRHQTSIVIQKTQAMTVFIILNEQLIGSTKHGGVECLGNSLRPLVVGFNRATIPNSKLKDYISKWSHLPHRKVERGLWILEPSLAPLIPPAS